jgi:hypothetical protein
MTILRPAFLAGIKPGDVIMLKVYCNAVAMFLASALRRGRHPLKIFEMACLA